MRVVHALPWMLILFGSDSGSLGGESADVKTRQQQEPCPDEIPSRGKYVNLSYGFSIIIPPGLEGLWNSASCSKQGEECTCMSDHGRVIPLSAKPYLPDRHVEAYADYGADLENGTVSEAVTSNLQSIQERSQPGTMSVRHKRAIRLAGLDAQRVIVRYSDKRLHAWMIEDFIEAIGNGVRYMLYLRTPEATYTQDRSIFDRVIATFKLAQNHANN